MPWVIMAQLVPEERRFSGNGKWRNDPQEVDEADDPDSAAYLVGEYQLAYGPTYTVWAKKVLGDGEVKRVEADEEVDIED